MNTIGLVTPFEKKSDDLEIKVKVTRSSKMTLKRQIIKISEKIKVDVKLLVYDKFHIEEIRKHAILMTLINGQGQRSTLKFQDSCSSIAIVNQPIFISF